MVPATGHTKIAIVKQFCCTHYSSQAATKASFWATKKKKSIRQKTSNYPIVFLQKGDQLLWWEYFCVRFARLSLLNTAAKQKEHHKKKNTTLRQVFMQMALHLNKLRQQGEMYFVGKCKQQVLTGLLKKTGKRTIPKTLSLLKIF